MDIDNQVINEFINHLAPGKVIDLQLGGLSFARIKPTVIGIDLGRYLLVKFPNNLNPADYKYVLISGGAVIVRYILEGDHGECVAFSTTIQQVSIAPNRLVFLNYPSRIENRQLRAHQRERTHLPAQISLKTAGNTISGKRIDGYIVNISAHGCQFSFRPEDGRSGIKLSPIHIKITLTGIDQPLIIEAEVKNNRHENGHTLVGIMFDKGSLPKISELLNEMDID